MPVQFTIDVERLCAANYDRDISSPGGPHSSLAADSHRARALLAKLLRIHARQVAEGSRAADWDPLATWYLMIGDCCEDVSMDS